MCTGQRWHWFLGGTKMSHVPELTSASQCDGLREVHTIHTVALVAPGWCRPMMRQKSISQLYSFTPKRPLHIRGTCLRFPFPYSNLLLIRELCSVVQARTTLSTRIQACDRRAAVQAVIVITLALSTSACNSGNVELPFVTNKQTKYSNQVVYSYIIHKAKATIALERPLPPAPARRARAARVPASPRTPVYDDFPTVQHTTMASSR